jgi:hypothetical protein
LHNELDPRHESMAVLLSLAVVSDTRQSTRHLSIALQPATRVDYRKYLTVPLGFVAEKRTQEVHWHIHTCLTYESSTRGDGATSSVTSDIHDQEQHLLNHSINKPPSRGGNLAPNLPFYSNKFQSSIAADCHRVGRFPFAGTSNAREVST